MPKFIGYLLLSVNALAVIPNAMADITLNNNCQNGLIFTLQSIPFYESPPCFDATGGIWPSVGESGKFTHLKCKWYTLSGIGGIPEPQAVNGATINIESQGSDCVCSNCQ